MGYGTRDGKIRTYTPDNTDTKLYLRSDMYTLAGIMEVCSSVWPETPLEDISISAEHIHTDCLGYDLYDSSDYTDYIIAERRL